jgi:hypothetical protein
MDGSERYDELCDDLTARHPEVERTKMMGMPSLKANGRLIAGFVAAEDAMAFKLTDPDAHAAALALSGAHLFDPSGRGRPMRQWVVVPPAHAARWPELATLALAPG